MKLKIIISTCFLVLSLNALAFNVTGDSFKSKFDITSITVEQDQSTINATSAAAGQYGKVYLSYTLKSNDTARNQGTFEGHGRGISPDGDLAAGILKGVWTRDGKIISIKSLDDVTDGINYMQGEIDLISGEINIEVFKVN
ncbi:MAG: hypothetical protein ACO397_01970 [Gammaproteobacteria bacterium]|jgi:hypothetical protein